MSECDLPRFFLHRDARPQFVIAHGKHHRRTAYRAVDRGLSCARRRCRGCRPPAPIPAEAKPIHPPRQPLTTGIRAPPLRMAIQPQRSSVRPKRHRRLARQAEGRENGRGVGQAGVVREVVFARDCV